MSGEDKLLISDVLKFAEDVGKLAYSQGYSDAYTHKNKNFEKSLAYKKILEMKEKNNER